MSGDLYDSEVAELRQLCKDYRQLKDERYRLEDEIERLEEFLVDSEAGHAQRVKKIRDERAEQEFAQKLRIRALQRRVDELKNAIIDCKAIIALEQEDEHRRRQQQQQLQRDQELAESLKPRECIVCMESYDNEEVFELQNCFHVLHLPCLQQQCVADIRANSFPVKCPVLGCGVPISQSDINMLVSPDVMDIYLKHTVEQYLSTAKVWRCKTADCPVTIELEGPVTDFRCPECKKHYCIPCDCEFHDNMTCEQYQKWKVENSSADDRFEELIRTGSVRRCQCGIPLVKVEGCDCITCRCGCKMCWQCMQLLTPANPRCAHAWYH